ncbi:MAG: hypothetical protein GX856_09885 [Gammaproteobacteria bacterium]|jgi:hypothetical protein|nr:hypothetical protein [Gammaproteobacteria bacterium]
MTEVAIQLDEHNRDVLYARRVELFFDPNEDGSPSVQGRIVWHTEWWHYSGDVLRAKTMGPKIRQEVADIIGNEYGGVTAPEIIGGIKAAFIQHALEHLGIGDE